MAAHRAIADRQTYRYALKWIMEVLTGTHPYTSICGPLRELDRHPFDPSWEGPVALAGSPGVTASIARFTRSLALMIVRRNLDILGLRRYLIDTDFGPDKHRVFYEVRAGTLKHGPAEVLLVGGCTDYSGEGGRGKRTMDALFLVLSDIFDVPIEEVHLSRGTDRALDGLLKTAQELIER